MLLGGAGGAALAYGLFPPTYRAQAVVAVEPASDATVSSRRLDEIVARLIDSLRSPAVLSEAAPVDRARLAVTTDAIAARQVLLQYDAATAQEAATCVGRVLDAAVAAGELWTHEAVRGQLVTLRDKLDDDRAKLSELRTLHRQAVEAFGMLPLDQRMADRRRELDRVTVQLREIDLTLRSVADEPEAEPSPRDTDEPPGRWATLLREILAAIPRGPAVVSVVDLDGTPTPPMTVSQLHARRAGLEWMRGVISSELGDLIAKAATIQTLHRKVIESTAALDAAQEQVDLLANTDAAVARLWVLDQGERATLAKPIEYATVLAGSGAMGAALFAMLAVAVLSSDRRLRRSDQVAAAPGDPPVLGAVPTLDPKRQDTDRLAQAVHEVRSILEIHAENHGFRVFTVVAPTRGSGATSLTVGLGTSLALSGSRILVVDMDLGARAGDAVPGAQTVDQVMHAMGYVDESDRALVRRDDPGDGRGLAGMFDGASLRQSVLPTKVRNLDVLHAHAVDVQRLGRVSSRVLSSIVAQARAEYDLVLIDAGPVPGSVEGLLAAAHADGVVVVVQRCASQRLYDRTLGQLRLAEANVIGTVFNRAALRDAAVSLQRDEVAPLSAARPRRSDRADRADAGSGILAAAVQARAGSHAFDRHDRVTAEQITPSPGLTAAPVLDDDDVRVATADDTDGWETQLEASLDRLVDEVSAPADAGSQRA
jgi:Mrp family chromosome partitioning ATPase